MDMQDMITECKEKRSEAVRHRQEARRLESEVRSLKKDIARLEFGEIGQEIVWLRYGERRRGTIAAYTDSWDDEKLICILKTVIDGVESEDHISDGKLIIQRIENG